MKKYVLLAAGIVTLAFIIFGIVSLFSISTIQQLLHPFRASTGNSMRTVNKINPEKPAISQLKMSEKFTNGIDHTFWVIPDSATRSGSVDVSAGTMKVTVTSKSSPPPFVGIVSRLPFDANLKVTAQLETSVPSSGEARADLSLCDDTCINGLFVSLVQDKNGRSLHVRSRKDAKQPAPDKVISVNKTTQFVKVKLGRYQNKGVLFLVDTKSEAVLADFDNVYGGPLYIRLGVSKSEVPDRVTATFNQVIITADANK